MLATSRDISSLLFSFAFLQFDFDGMSGWLALHVELDSRGPLSLVLAKRWSHWLYGARLCGGVGFSIRIDLSGAAHDGRVPRRNETRHRETKEIEDTSIYL